MDINATSRFLPAILCAEFDSPIDALVGMHVPLGEAMEVVVAAWSLGAVNCVLAEVDGGRPVAAIRQEDGRWAGCNAFPDLLCTSLAEAQRQLKKLVKRGRRGCVGELRCVA